ncbi:hypothetical protein HNR06_005356 [Nocardiopsis arvandica]|uniref:Uncharacterized protein n=1 Tax=Nocardiopsis sinuspersici TaxID=501010 RepID=A0A7Y9XJ95_9ACTN|nr:hypothetical protein [Nocardiopsis sinuspersici]NYH55767.1 hypothetical protein [Nocardiopsis sinuspersici]
MSALPRFSLDPSLPPPVTQRLAWSLDPATSKELERSWELLWPWFIIVPTATLFAWGILDGLGGLIVLCGGLTALLIPLYSLHRRHRLKDSALKRYEHHCVHPDDLAETEGDLLLSAQRGVDAILHSDLYDRGIIDDQLLSTVVLRDVEWSIARQMSSQSELRDRISSTPTPGERSQAVAAGLLASLEEEQQLTRRQVRTITEYADHVRQAEKELADLVAARELSRLRSDPGSADPWVEAAASADAASLRSLSRVRDAAKQIADMPLLP